MNYIAILEYVGVLAFAISGANVAIEEEFDLFGIYILATVTAMGGGVIRDIVTDVSIPVFFQDYKTIPYIFVGATIAIILKGNIKYKGFFNFADALGLAAFFVSAGMKAIDKNYNFLLFLFVASITGVGGGLLRDIITNRKPVVFQHDIYCMAGILGVVLLWFIYPYQEHLGKFVAIITIIIIRLISYYKDIHLPVVKAKEITIEN